MKKKPRIIRLVLLPALAGFLISRLLVSCVTAPEHQADPLPVQDAPARAETHVHLPAPEPEPEPDPLAKYNRVENCLITYYCTELRPHICGTGNGITASGAPVQAGVSAAVDPSLIPLGSKVVVDYGDGVLHEYIAQDVGGWVNGAHVDLAVETHDEALQMGRRTATVYWLEG